MRRLFGEAETPPTEQYLGGWTQCRAGVNGAVRVRRRITVLAKRSGPTMAGAPTGPAVQRLDLGP